MVMDPELADRLRAVVTESDEVLAEEIGSADPVARRREADALRAKAHALRRLERHQESVAAWDERRGTPRRSILSRSALPGRS